MLKTFLSLSIQSSHKVVKCCLDLDDLSIQCILWIWRQQFFMCISRSFIPWSFLSWISSISPVRSIVVLYKKQNFYLSWKGRKEIIISYNKKWKTMSMCCVRKAIFILHPSSCPSECVNSILVRVRRWRIGGGFLSYSFIKCY